MDTPIFNRIYRDLELANEAFFGAAMNKLMGLDIDEETNKEFQCFEIIQSLRKNRLLLGAELEKVYISAESMFPRLSERLKLKLEDSLNTAKRNSRIFKQLIDFKEIISDKKGNKKLNRKGFVLSQFEYKRTGLEHNFKRAEHQYENRNKMKDVEQYNLDYIPDPIQRGKQLKELEEIDVEFNHPVTKKQYVDIYALVLFRLYEVVCYEINKISPPKIYEATEETIPENLHKIEGYNEKLLFIKHSGILDALKLKYKKRNGEPHFAKIASIISYITDLPSAETIKGKLGFLETPEKTGKNNPYTSESVPKVIKALEDAGITDDWLLDFSRRYYNKYKD